MPIQAPVITVQSKSTRGWTQLVLQLYKLTVTHSFRACNGRFPADNPGKFTYNRLGNSSIIDYIMVNVEFWEFIKNVGVIPRLESDHNPLVLELSSLF